MKNVSLEPCINQPYSTDLALLDFVYFPNLKSYLRGTDLIGALISVMQYKNATDH